MKRNLESVLPLPIKFYIHELDFTVTPKLKQINPTEWKTIETDLHLKITKLGDEIEIMVVDVIGPLHRDVYYGDMLVLRNVSNLSKGSTWKGSSALSKEVVKGDTVVDTRGIAPVSHHDIEPIKVEKIEQQVEKVEKTETEEHPRIKVASPGGIRVAVFNQIYGMHPYGGPAVYGYNVAAMLKRAHIPFTMFHKSAIHRDYIQEWDEVRPYSEFKPDDFNVFYVMNDFSIAQALHTKGYKPIILGSNIVPNSLPEFCQRTNPPLISSEYEVKVVKSLKGVFWLAQSNYQRREYRRLGLPREVPVYIAVNPVDTDLFVPTNIQKEIDICWSGKNTWAKGIPLLKDIAWTHTNYSFMLISEDLLDMFSTYQNVQFVIGKTIFQLKDHIPKAKVFLSTSYKEFQPLAMLEAMSCGLPPVGFKTSGISEIIRDGDNGITVDCFGLDHLGIALDDLLTDDELRMELGRNARRYVVAHHGYEHCAKQYMKLFKLALEMVK